jgi:hypothetical protein
MPTQVTHADLFLLCLQSEEEACFQDHPQESETQANKNDLGQSLHRSAPNANGVEMATLPQRSTVGHSMMMIGERHFWICRGKRSNPSLASR